MTQPATSQGAPVRVVPRPEHAQRAPWRWQRVLQAPHRLAFLFAMAVLVASGLWWAAVQLDRAGAGFGLAYAVSPSLTHAAAMSFGFIPLFFSGFLFTAGPKWLGLPPPTARQVLPALLAQLAGWLLWLAGAHVDAALAVTGAALAALGLGAATVRFWRMLLASRVPDQLHARHIGLALVSGCICVGGLALSLAAGHDELARAAVLTGLWSFVFVVFVTVAHRMIPFFSADALPALGAWQPNWVLDLLLASALFEAAAVWLDLSIAGNPLWLALRGAVELAAGALLLWLAVAWGLAKSLKIRLLAMMHLGLLWLALALTLAGLGHLLALATGAPVLPLAPLHALTMGCLGSRMLAMVTRVTCGHGGRPNVADDFVWLLFWLLQAATLLRIAATLPLEASQWLLVAAALAWAALTLTWGVRSGSMSGRPRADGRPG